MIDSPVGARVFVGQMAICGTKTHLASVKKGCFIASTDHSISLVLERASAGDVEKLINRDLEISRSRHLDIALF